MKFALKSIALVATVAATLYVTGAFNGLHFDPSKIGEAHVKWVLSKFSAAGTQCKPAIFSDARARYRKAHGAAEDCVNAALHISADWWNNIACAKEREAEAGIKVQLDAAKKACSAQS